MGKTANVPSIYVILRNNDKVAFLLRSKTGYKNGTHTLPASHVKDWGNYRAAAMHEALEEVGVHIKSEDLDHAYTLQRYEVDNGDVRVDIFFDAKKWEGEPKNMEPHKHSELAWFSVNDMPDTIMDYQADVLRAIARGDRYHERGWDS